MKRAAVSLPDELVLEILVRLKDDAETLFRCATACKAWHGLVADPSFLRRCWREEDTSIAGFFTREQRQGEGVGRPCFVPVRGSAMGRHALSAFVKPAAGVMLERAAPLVSRHGLLLVRLSPGVNPDPKAVRLAVCNLLVGDLHVLPLLKCGLVDELRYNWSGYALLSGPDWLSEGESERPGLPSSNSPSFKVVIIDSEYNLHTFTSGEASWSAPTKCLQDNASTRDYTPVSHDTAVVCRGTAHWLFYNRLTSSLCTFDMDGKTGRVSLTSRITFEHFEEADFATCCPCLTVFNGMLSLFYVQREGSEVVIGEIDVETSEWLHAWKIELVEDGKQLTEQATNLYMLGEKYGAMIVQVSSRRVYVADLETQTVKQLVDWPQRHANRADVVSLQMDWFTFFLSRLGKQRNDAGRIHRQ